MNKRYNRKMHDGWARDLGRLLLALLLFGSLFGQARTASGGQAEHGQAPKPQSKSQRPATGDKPATETDRERRQQAYVLYPKAMEEAARGNLYQAIETMRQIITLDPASPVPHVTLGEFQYGLRNTNDARNEAQAALKLDPKHAGAHKLLGRLFRDEALASADQDKAKQAIQEFRQVVESDDLDIEAWQSLAQLYELTGQQDELVKALTRWTSNDPAAGGAFYVLANYYYNQRKYREATENASKAYTANPTAETAMLLARSLLAQGQTTEALRIFREAREKNSGDAKLEVNYAEALVYSGQYQEAITALQTQLKSGPGNTDALRLLAQAYQRSGRREDAIDVLKDGLKDIDVSDGLNLQYLLAHIYEETKDIDKAVATYQTILNTILNPDGTVSKDYDKATEDVLTRIVYAYWRANRRDDTMRAVERMRTVLGSTNPQPDLLLLDILMEERKYDEVVKKAQEIGQRFPDKREFRLVQAQALGNMGKVDDAGRLLNGLLTNSSEDISVYMMKAMVAFDAEHFTEAKAALEEGLRRDPQNTGLLIQLSMVQEKLMKPSEAEATLRAILDRDPDNQTALNNLGYYLAERGERLDEAMSFIQRAVNIDPTNGSFLDSLGWVYFQMGRLKEAEQYLNQALDHEPQDGSIYEHLGDLYLKQGVPQKARQSFEKALNLVRRKDEQDRIRKKLQPLIAEKK